MKKRRIVCFLIGYALAFLPLLVNSQEILQSGKATYASYPPYHEAARPTVEGVEGWGDLSYEMTHRELYVINPEGKAVPSTDYWTDLVVKQYSGNLWNYPGVVNAEDYGVYIEFPKRWRDDGWEFLADSRIEIKGDGFRPVDARARNWQDWSLEMVLQESASEYMEVTMAHGIPFTYIEFTGVKPQIVATATRYFDDSNNDITFPYTGDHFGIQIGEDHYGIFAPNNTTFTLQGTSIEASFAGAQQFIVVGTMMQASHLATFNQYAYAIPRGSEVSWNYNEEAGKITTTWNLSTQNLKGEGQLDVIQGWHPHHYDVEKGTELNFGFNGMEYPTPRGKLKCSTGRSFSITYPFNGLLPSMPIPETDNTLPNPYDENVLRELISHYEKLTDYGTETYWGGKKILHFGRLMQLTDQLGDTEAFEMYKGRLMTALTDWFEYDPYETEHYYGMYPNWGSLIGFNTRDNNLPGIDLLQDHAFCYAYHLYAAAIMCMYDEQFKNDYKDFLTLMVKDYANWDRNDDRFPIFRSLDPWAGHSYSGGLAGDNGNGQESSSEAMQAWGAMVILGTVIEDDAMRDAGIFGYVTEARGVAEYWFDRDRENIDYTKYQYPYNGNLASNGVGWWKWFVGDDIWQHAIQWLPMSPLLKYLYEDVEFAAWDYNTMYNVSRTIGGWDSDLGNSAALGNVCLSYLQISDPDQAAALFDDIYARQTPAFTSMDGEQYTYQFIHSHRTLGEIQWNWHTNVATSTVYYNARKGVRTVVVYNPETTEQEVKVFENGNLYTTIKVPARTQISHKLDATLSEIALDAPAKTIAPNATLQISAQTLDQYGATYDAGVSFTVVSGNGSIDQNGNFSSSQIGTCVVRATSGSVSNELTIRVNNTPYLDRIAIEPDVETIEIGAETKFTATGFDQYNDEYELTPNWSVTSGGFINNGVFTPTNINANTTLTVSQNGVQANESFSVRYPLNNLAFGKDAYASSVEVAEHIEPGSVDAIRVTDGDQYSRWSSELADPQWIYVDLEEQINIEKVIIRWETAAAANYDVQVSDDANSWQTVYSDPNANGGIDEISLSTTARYVRVYGHTRLTEYGYSIFEIEVYGTKSGVNTVVVSPAQIQVDDHNSQQFTAVCYDKDGNVINSGISWSVQGKGSIDANGVYTANGGGYWEFPVFNIVATAGGATGYAQVRVDHIIEASAINILPATADTARVKVVQNGLFTFTADVTDQFGMDFDGDLTWSVSGGGSISGGVFSASQLGDYTVSVTDGNLTAYAYVSVVPINGINVALNKSTSTSSVEGGDVSDNAVDGTVETRWGSIWEVDPQWISIDLESTYILDRTEIVWENAAASDYEIKISQDGINWTTIQHLQNQDGGTDVVALNNAEARYIMMYGNERLAGYGYSIKEFEVYANGIVKKDPYLARIEISPAIIEVCQGSTIDFTAQGFDQFNNNFSIDGAQWTTTCGSLNGSTYTASDLGNCSVTISKDGVSATCQISIIDCTPDCDLVSSGKAVEASSQEGDYVGQNITDGNMDSRWSSDFSDPQWVRIDLEATYSICNVVLNWEGAYGSDYEIRLSATTDLNAAQVIATVNGGDGAQDNISITSTATGRYIWMYGIARGTGWGYSLWEMQVYGKLAGQDLPPVADAGDDIILPAGSTTAQLNGNGSYDPEGNSLTHTWSQTAGPEVSISTTTAANPSISGLSDGQTYTFSLVVNDGAQNSAVSTVNVTVSEPVGECNLIAKPKFATSSSAMAGGSPSNVYDDDMNTRWESEYTDNEWLALNLESTYSICEVRITWEGAFGKDYEIRLGSNDDVNTAQTIATVTNGNGGEDIITTTNTATGQYLFVKGNTRGTGWGYSIWEMEIYGKLSGENLAPVANAGADISLSAGSTLTTLDGSASYDPEGAAITYNWSQISGVAVNINTVNSQNPEISGLSNGETYTFALTVNDGAKNSLYADEVIVDVASDIVCTLVSEGKTATHSSMEGDYSASNVVDGSMDTRWSSEFADPQWVSIDLGEEHTICSVELYWEGASGKTYEIQLSNDPNFGTYDVIASEAVGDGGTDILETDNSKTGRYIRMYGTVRNTGYGYSLWEMKVFGQAIATKNAGSIADESSEQIETNIDFTLYPNPVSDVLTVNINKADNQDYFISIRDLSGKTAIKKQIGANGRIDLSGLESGTYIYIIGNDNVTKSGVLIKR